MNKEVNYHNPESCNKCSRDNQLEAISYENGFISECKTKCSTCGFEDYWAYGWFESGTEMLSKCLTYNFNSCNKEEKE